MERGRGSRAARRLAWLPLALAAGAACHSAPGPVARPAASPAGARRDPADRTADRAPDHARAATAEDWQGSAHPRAEELFVGRFAGVRVVPAPGGIQIRIRGQTSINGSNEPLFIIDGMPMSPGSGGLISINPLDIAKIEVLKDIGSTAYYGVRGANGVVLITTKHAP